MGYIFLYKKECGEMGNNGEDEMIKILMSK
jgi:hypothetical protein